MSQTQLIVLGIIVLILGVVAFFVIRRQRYVRALRSRGWRFDSRPSLPEVLDHLAPPFGLGFDRSVDELVSGPTQAGVAFRVFEYTRAQGWGRFDERVASLALPGPLPDLFLSAGPPRAGTDLPAFTVAHGWTVSVADQAYAQQLLNPAVLAAVDAFGRAGHRVDLSVDGAQLVAVGAPKDPEELAAYLESLAPVAQAVAATDLTAWARSPRTPGFGFYHRPDWVLVGRDDDLIGKYGLTTAGFGHDTTQVVRGGNDGLPIEAFVHRWKTQRTETSTDSEGRTTTRTVTEQHSEVVANIVLPFSFPLLAVNGGRGGEKVRFESEQFNDRFDVRTTSPKLASDVLHPRTMEYLLAVNPPGFRIDGRRMRFTVPQHDSQLVGACADLAHGLFGRVPSFVWPDLQLTPPPFRPVGPAGSPASSTGGSPPHV